MRARRRIALIAASTALVLLVLEAGARVVAHATGRERGLALDARLGWRPIPDVEKRGALWGAERPARTNALGWRDRERTVAKTPGARRALLLGDSFVFGVGVDDGQRVSEALESEVPGLEAWNLGVTAYGPDQVALLLESVAAEYRPDVVVWFACLANDVDDVRYERRYGYAKPWFSLEGGALVPHAPEPSLLERARDASYLCEIACAPLDARRLAHRFAAPWKERDGLELFGLLAVRIAAESARRGAAFLCVAIPSGDAQLDARALGELRARGLEPLELAPAFAAESARGADLFLADGHWNAAGHALAAQRVADALKLRGDAR